MRSVTIARQPDVPGARKCRNDLDHVQLCARHRLRQDPRVDDHRQARERAASAAQRPRRTRGIADGGGRDGCADEHVVGEHVAQAGLQASLGKRSFQRISGKLDGGATNIRARTVLASESRAQPQ